MQSPNLLPYPLKAMLLLQDLYNPWKVILPMPDLLKKCQKEEAFYHQRCDGYLCKNQFKMIQGKNKEVLLPCGCQELREHVQAYLSSFCLECKRRVIINKKKEGALCNICKIKEKYRQTLSQKALKSKQRSEESESKSSQSSSRDITSSEPSEWSMDSQQQPQSSDFRRVQTSKQQKTPQQLRQKKVLIGNLRSKLDQKRLQLHMSEFTRMQFRTSLLKEKDDNCLFCLQSFTLARRPMMICLQQHLLCEICFNSTHNLLNCPLCREQISRRHVNIHKERFRLLQLQKNCSEYFDSHYRRQELFNERNKDKIIITRRSIHTQTDILSTMKKKPQGIPQRRAKMGIND